MKKASTIDILNALVQLHCRSLPVYLSDAKPWTPTKHSGGQALVESIVEDQNEIAAELAELVQSRGEIVERGAFPTEFTDLHDLSVDYLIRESACLQSKNVEAVERAVELLAGDGEAQSLCQRVLGVARAHLDSLNLYVSNL